MKIHEEVKKYRKNNGLSQAQLAKRFKVHRSQITRWENAKVKPNKYTEYFLKMEGII